MGEGVEWRGNNGNQMKVMSLVKHGNLGSEIVYFHTLIQCGNTALNNRQRLMIEWSFKLVTEVTSDLSGFQAIPRTNLSFYQ